MIQNDEINDDIDYNDDEREDDESEVDEIDLFYSSIGRNSRPVACFVFDSLSDYSCVSHTSTVVGNIVDSWAGSGRTMGISVAVLTQRFGIIKKYLFFIIISIFVGFLGVIVMYFLPKHKRIEAEEPSYV